MLKVHAHEYLSLGGMIKEGYAAQVQANRSVEPTHTAARTRKKALVRFVAVPGITERVSRLASRAQTESADSGCEP